MQALTATRKQVTDPLAGRMLIYACALGALILGLAGLLVSAGHGVGSPWAVAVLAGAAAVAERGRVRLERGSATESSISNLPVLFHGRRIRAVAGGDCGRWVDAGRGPSAVHETGHIHIDQGDCRRPDWCRCDACPRPRSKRGRSCGSRNSSWRTDSRGRRSRVCVPDHPPSISSGPGRWQGFSCQSPFSQCRFTRRS